MDEINAKVNAWRNAHFSRRNSTPNRHVLEARLESNVDSKATRLLNSFRRKTIHSPTLHRLSLTHVLEHDEEDPFVELNLSSGISVLPRIKSLKSSSSNFF